jgi:hypothetical protein
MAGFLNKAVGGGLSGLSEVGTSMTGVKVVEGYAPAAKCRATIKI